MIKKLPPETLKYLLDLYNKIWKEGIVPEGYKSAIITPLLKEGKQPKDVTVKPVLSEPLSYEILKNRTH